MSVYYDVKERLLSFGKYAEDAQSDVLVTLIQTFVERIYITDENDERYCHIFIKGCTKEDYDEFFRATGYISGTRENGNITSKLPLCDSDECRECNMILTPSALYVLSCLCLLFKFKDLLDVFGIAGGFYTIKKMINT